MDYIALRRIKIGGVVYNLGDTITADALAGADVYKLLHRKWIQFAGNSEDGGESGVGPPGQDGADGLPGPEGPPGQDGQVPYPITLAMLGIDTSGLDPAKEYVLKTARSSGTWTLALEKIVRS